MRTKTQMASMKEGIQDMAKEIETLVESGEVEQVESGLRFKDVRLVHQVLEPRRRKRENKK